MSYVADNYDLWEAYDRKQAQQLEKLPVCADCGEPIQQEDAFYYHGDWLCDVCIACYRRPVLEE